MCTAWRFWNDPKKKLPEIGQKVLVAYMSPYDHVWRTTAEYVHHLSVLAENFYDFDIECEVTTDEYGQEWVKAGWYEMPTEAEDSFLIPGDVLAWIELPELPCDWRRS